MEGVYDRSFPKNFLRFLAASLGSLYLSGCINQDKLLSRSLSPEKITPTPFLPGPQNTAEADPTAEPEELPTQEPSTTPYSSISGSGCSPPRRS